MKYQQNTMKIEANQEKTAKNILIMNNRQIIGKSVTVAFWRRKLEGFGGSQPANQPAIQPANHPANQPVNNANLVGSCGSTCFFVLLLRYCC